jgi:hypothetical protein
MGPLPHHLHQNDEQVASFGLMGKPEGYYFPKQLNNHGGWFPYTFFGLNPGTAKDDVKKCIDNWNKGDNGILNISRAYKLKLGTGWDIPPRILHAPGSLLTYEPQRSSDVFAMHQSLVWDSPISKDMLTRYLPDSKKNDINYIIDMIDFDLNCDPNFHENRNLEPRPVKPPEEMKRDGYEEYDVVYNSCYFTSKEITVFPGRRVTMKQKEAYGLIVMEGHGSLGGLCIESPALIRFGGMTSDELFVTQKKAREGVEIINESETENLVILMHCGPE